MSTSLLVGVGATLALNFIFGRGGANQVNEGPRLQDLTVQASTYGQYISKLFGKTRIAGNIIWADPIQEHRYEDRQRVGKGGGRQEVVNVYYRYTASFAVALCEGEVNGFGKMWLDGKIYANHNNVAGSYNFSEFLRLFRVNLRSKFNKGAVRFYTGSESQTADPLIASRVGAANCPAFRGLCYLVFEDLPLDDYGNRIPQVNIEVIRTATLTQGKRVTIATTPGSFPAGRILRYMTNFNAGVMRIYPNTLNKIELIGIDGTYYGDTSYDQQIDKWRVDDGYDACVGYLNGFYMLAYGNANNPLNHSSDPPLVYPWTGGLIVANDITSVNARRKQDILKQLEADTTLYACSMVFSQNTQRGLAIFGTARQTPTKWYLFYLNQNGVPIVERSGTTSTITTSSNLPFGNGSYQEVPSGTIQSRNFGTAPSTFGFVQCGMLEDDYEHFWLFSFTDRPCYKIEPDSSITRVFDTQSNAASGLTNTMWANNGLCITVSTQVNTPFGNYYVQINSRDAFYTAGNVTVGSVVNQICQDMGISASDIDTTALTENVEGYVIGRSITARGALEQLSQIYQFDGIESDYKLKFVLRSTGSYTDIPETELAVGLTPDALVEPVKIRKKLETELPKRVNINYINASREYDIDNQHYERIETISEREITLDVPIVLTASRAKQAAEILLNSAWKERLSYSASVALKHIKLDPSDKLTLNKGDLAFNARLTNTEVTKEGVINLTAVGTGDFVYSSTATSATEPVTDNPDSFPGGCDPIVLDINILRDIDTAPGYYAALGAYFSTWSGGLLLQSDDGVDYQNLIGINSSPPRGVITATISAPVDFYVPDYATVINVTLYYGTLSSVSEEDWLNNKNVALVGDELIGFKNAVLQANGSYNVSTLLRGLRGTEGFASTHAVIDRFLVLTDGGIDRINVEQSLIGQSRYFKGFSLGAGALGSEATSFTFSGVGLKPYAVAAPAASRDGSNNITLTWVPRTRVGGQWQDAVETFQIDSPESYSIDILDPTQTSVVRTLTSSSASVAYTAAQQITDGYTPGNTVYGNIYQLNAIIGRGYAKYFGL